MKKRRKERVEGKRREQGETEILGDHGHFGLKGIALPDPVFT